MKYSIKTTLLKMVKYFVAFLLPVLVDQFIVAYPQIAQLTVGTIILGILNWLKSKAGLLAAGTNAPKANFWYRVSRLIP